MQDKALNDFMDFVRLFAQGPETIRLWTKEVEATVKEYRDKLGAYDTLEKAERHLATAVDRETAATKQLQEVDKQADDIFFRAQAEALRMKSEAENHLQETKRLRDETQAIMERVQRALTEHNH